MPTRTLIAALALFALLGQPSWAQGNGNGNGNSGGESRGSDSGNGGNSSGGNGNGNAGDRDGNGNNGGGNNGGGNNGGGNGNGNGNSGSAGEAGRSNPGDENAGPGNNSGHGGGGTGSNGRANAGAPGQSRSREEPVGESPERSALEAVRSGKAVPLESLLPDVRANTGGEVIDAELLTVDGFLLYGIKVLTPAGRVSVQYYYANSGRPVRGR